MNKTSLRCRTLVVLFGVLFVACDLRAQQMASAELPDAPLSQQTGSASTGTPQPPEQESQQATGATRLLPGFPSVSASLHLPPQTVKEKFFVATRDSFGFTRRLRCRRRWPANRTLRRKTPEFGHGGIAYGRYLWHTYVDQTSENYLVEFIVPVATHEDTRYYTLGPGKGAIKRMGYALSRAVVTRNDAGNETFNASEVIGAGAAAGISNLYYPSPERTVSNTADKWATNVGIDAATFIIREFWPDINHLLFHGDKAPTATH